MIQGRVHSIQSLGTLDGPGVRFVVFLQGCNLRCGCCHNPDTWQTDGGTLHTPESLIQKALHYREYFAQNGGVTLSGGEPLMQTEFATAFFRAAHREHLHTCLDTSGSILYDGVKALLSETDRVLLDIKYTTDEQYRAHVGCSMDAPLRFLAYLNEQKIPTTIRQVIIPTLNDNAQSILSLKEIVQAHPCIDKVELLPFRKICQVKYDKMEIPFRMAHLPEPDAAVIRELEALLHK